MSFLILIHCSLLILLLLGSASDRLVLDGVVRLEDPEHDALVALRRDGTVSFHDPVAPAAGLFLQRVGTISCKKANCLQNLIRFRL